MKKKQKIGIFGGSFNPPHQGHLNALSLVQKRLGLGHVYVVPTSHNPLKPLIEGPTPEQRLEMTRLAIEILGEKFEVLDWEVFNEKESYSIDLLRQLHKEHSAEELYFVLGIDQLQGMESWKSHRQLFESCNWVFVSRPGFKLPEKKEDLPEWLQPQIVDMQFNLAVLQKGLQIQFVQIQDQDISSTQIRKWIRTGKKVDELLPLPVEDFIRKNKIYQNLAEKVVDPESFLRFCANVLFEKKAIAVRGFDLQKIFYPCEFALVCSGTSTRHASSLSDNLARAVKDEYGIWPQGTEGAEEGRWVLLDYGSVMVHIFYDFVRREYSIEQLWKESTELPLKDPSLP